MPTGRTGRKWGSSVLPLNVSPFHSSSRYGLPVLPVDASCLGNAVLRVAPRRSINRYDFFDRGGEVFGVGPVCRNVGA